MLDYFATGRVVVAINRDCIIPTSVNNPIFDGIEAEKVEVIFQPKNISNNNDISAILLVYIKGTDALSVINTIEQLSAHPCVVFARPDYILYRHVIPNDQFYDRLWGMDKIKAPMAWNYSTGSRQVVVGVLDSGVNYEHPDLKDNMWRAPYGQGLHGRDFANDSNYPMDVTGHGTHVAGTIGAVGNNLIGVTGVAWHISIAAMKIGSSIFTSSAAIRAVDYANRNNIAILNCSWGTRAYCPCQKFVISNYDGLVIASAGNDGSNNDIFPVFPASYECENIISVASASISDELSLFSNYGAVSVDIAAPGCGIFSTDVSAEYSYMDGTSMAAPHVAGAAALLKAYRPYLSVKEMKKVIFSSVDKQPQFAGRILTGGTLNTSKMMEMAT